MPKTLPAKNDTTDPVVEVLRRVEARISSGWCQGVSARDKTGTSVDPWSSRASQWCLLGALYAETEGRLWVSRAVWDATGYVLATAMSEVAPQAERLAIFNDHPETDQARVLAVIHRAIALAAAPAAPSEERAP